MKTKIIFLIIASVSILGTLGLFYSPIVSGGIVNLEVRDEIKAGAKKLVLLGETSNFDRNDQFSIIFTIYSEDDFQGSSVKVDEKGKILEKSGPDIFREIIKTGVLSGVNGNWIVIADRSEPAFYQVGMEVIDENTGEKVRSHMQIYEIID